MDKNAIKKYAVWARQEFISRVTQKALQYGITDTEIVPADAASVNGVVLTAQQKKKRQALIAKIEAESFEQVMEEVSYTWFNRFSALRFMEVNGYLPTHVRVFTDEENRFKPQILAEAINLEIEGLDMEKVYALKDANDNEALFKYLIITQCNALSSILPGMFQKIDDYTELLFPDNLLREGSAIEQMIALIPEDDWKDAVQIIGWLYQYYNSEKKDEVFAALKKNIKITKENIPAATQLFTPDWIVRYMVENSLGRLWVEGHPNEELKSNWKYYLEEAEQEPDVQVKLAEIRKEYAALKPEDMKCIDPCMGSGHILAYLFDVLMQIYEAYGYTAREAVASIVKNNIYGLDIDDRAAQLANFVVMMKARQYDRRFFSRGIQPHVYAIVESNHVDAYAVNYFANGDTALTKAIKTIIEELYDAKEYGSILTVTQQDWAALYARFDEIREDINISREPVLNELLPLVQVAQALAQKYDVVVTNPPYMGSSGMSATLGDYVKKNYPDSKSDLFAVFIEKCGAMTAQSRYQAMITQHAWMFLSSFEKLRAKILLHDTVNMAHLGARAFEEIGGEVVQTTSFVFRNSHIQNCKGVYCRLIEPTTQQGKADMFLAGENRYESAQDNFSKIPGSPVAYWVSEQMLLDFSQGRPLKDKGDTRQGMATSDNNRFLRLWYEVNYQGIGFSCSNAEEAELKKMKWYPYNKGGEYRKWYGNIDYTINYENDGFEVKQYATSLYKTPTRTIKSMSEYFKPCLSWSKISSGSIAFRYYPQGFIFDVAGCCIFYTDDKEMMYDFGFLNSNVAKSILAAISPTLNYEAGHVASLPIIMDRNNIDSISDFVMANVQLSKEDWDSFEVSWDFSCHPLVKSKGSLEYCYNEWAHITRDRFLSVQKNEEQINSMFITIYEMEGELSEKVDKEDITIRLADLQRDIKSLISYAVGCMFGRYSLDVEGLAYAGGKLSEQWTEVGGQYYRNEVLEAYGCKKLQGFAGVAKGDGFGDGNLPTDEIIAERGNVCVVRPNEESSSVNSVEYCGGTSQKLHEGVHPVFVDCSGLKSGAANTDTDMRETWLSNKSTEQNCTCPYGRNRENAVCSEEVSDHCPLTPDHFGADKDNIIPICDDEYFTDDIVGRFVKFIETVYGKDSLKSNLKFIADALGGKGQPEDVIRNYFMNDFYTDHLKIYQKRPIYWLFDSGKKGGFKALIYLHRYQPDTIARIRTDYVHEQQSRYRTAITDLENRIADASTSERVRLTRQLSKLQDQSAEIHEYEEKIHHLADQYISIDLDDGVKKNYEIFQDVLAKIK